MMKKIALALGFAVSLATAAAAHHNMSAMFDFNQRFSETGTLSKVDWRNPHIYLTVDAKDQQGQAEAWSFEGPPPVFFAPVSSPGKTSRSRSGKRSPSRPVAPATDPR